MSSLRAGDNDLAPCLEKLWDSGATGDQTRKIEKSLLVDTLYNVRCAANIDFLRMPPCCGVLVGEPYARLSAPSRHRKDNNKLSGRTSHEAAHDTELVRQDNIQPAVRIHGSLHSLPSDFDV